MIRIILLFVVIYIIYKAVRRTKAQRKSENLGENKVQPPQLGIRTEANGNEVDKQMYRSMNDKGCQTEPERESNKYLDRWFTNEADIRKEDGDCRSHPQSEKNELLLGMRINRGNEVREYNSKESGNSDANRKTATNRGCSSLAFGGERSHRQLPEIKGRLSMVVTKDRPIVSSGPERQTLTNLEPGQSSPIKVPESITVRPRRKTFVIDTVEIDPHMAGQGDSQALIRLYSSLRPETATVPNTQPGGIRRYPDEKTAQVVNFFAIYEHYTSKEDPEPGKQF